MASELSNRSSDTRIAGSLPLDNLRCAVLGAGGFIGTNLCLALGGNVKRLRGLVRRQTGNPSVVGVEWVTGNYNDPEVVRRLISGCDTVFHLIGSTTPATGNRDMVADLEQNVVGSIRFLDLCLEENVKRVIFASSGGTVYGVPEEIPTLESSPKHPITAYGISKLAIEMYLELYRYHHGLDYRILRLSNPYGPHQAERNEHGVVSAFLRRAMTGQPVEVWGDGSVARDFIYIDDVVDALIRSALHCGEDRTFNIGSGTALSISELISTISHVLDRDVERLYFEARPVDVLRSALDISLAERALEWRPKISFTEGLAATAEWMAQNVLDSNAPKR